MQTVIRCNHPRCNKDITNDVKYYDKQKDGRYSLVYCENCNQKIKDSYYE